MAPPPEIAIPSTSVSSESSSKPFTLYNITLHLPLRSFVVQKRYSDFAALHAALVEQVRAAPPESLPGKRWLRSTVNSTELTQERQIGLERYLQAIAESADKRWRDTSAWRSFLNLPNISTTTSSASAAGAVGHAGAGAADPSTWLDIHREMKRFLHEVRQSLAKRDMAIDSGKTTAAAEAGTEAKRTIIKAGGLLGQLQEGLGKMQEGNKIGEGELRRRRDLLSAGKLERDALEKLSNNMPRSSIDLNQGPDGQVRASAFERGSSQQRSRPGGRVLGAPLPETSTTRKLDNQGVLMLQKQEMQAQYEQVEQLAAMIRRQKEMGLKINEEVEAQSEMLSRMDEDTTRLQGKIKVADNRIKKL